MSNKVLELEEWKSEVFKLIQWDFLCKEENWRQPLDIILKILHEKYKPQKNGIWLAAPKWTELFNWTSCPPDSVRAVILLMEPLEPFKDFESTGYALGVRRIRKSNHPCRTSLNFLLILQEILQLPIYKNELKEIINNGIDLEGLSKKGILFLNMASTRGNLEYDEIFDKWCGFTSEILKEISVRNSKKVLLFKLYHEQKLDIFNELRGKFKVIRLTFMENKHKCHLGLFKRADIKTYAHEISSVFKELEKILTKNEKQLEKSEKSIDRLTKSLSHHKVNDIGKLEAIRDMKKEKVAITEDINDIKEKTQNTKELIDLLRKWLIDNFKQLVSIGQIYNI